MASLTGARATSCSTARACWPGAPRNPPRAPPAPITRNWPPASPTHPQLVHRLSPAPGLTPITRCQAIMDDVPQHATPDSFRDDEAVANAQRRVVQQALGQEMESIKADLQEFNRDRVSRGLPSIALSDLPPITVASTGLSEGPSLLHALHSSAVDVIIYVPPHADMQQVLTRALGVAMKAVPSEKRVVDPFMVWTGWRTQRVVTARVMSNKPLATLQSTLVAAGPARLRVNLPEYRVHVSVPAGCAYSGGAVYIRRRFGRDGKPSLSEEELQGLRQLLRACYLTSGDDTPPWGGRLSAQDIQHATGTSEASQLGKRALGVAARALDAGKDMAEAVTEPVVGWAAPVFKRVGKSHGKQRGDAGWDDPDVQQAVSGLRAAGALVYPPGDVTTHDTTVFPDFEHELRVLESLLLVPLTYPLLHDAAHHNSPASKENPLGSHGVVLAGPAAADKWVAVRALATHADAVTVRLSLNVLSRAVEHAMQWRHFTQALEELMSQTRAVVVLDLDERMPAPAGSTSPARAWLPAHEHPGARRALDELVPSLRRAWPFACLVATTAMEWLAVDVDVRRHFVTWNSHPPLPYDMQAAELQPLVTIVEFQSAHPDLDQRARILRAMGQKLNDEQVQELAAATTGMTGRQLREMCAMAEASTAMRVFLELPGTPAVYAQTAPSFEDYQAALHMACRTVPKT